MAPRKGLVFVALIFGLTIQSLFGEIYYPDFTLSMMREGKSVAIFENTFLNKQLNGDFSNTLYLDFFRSRYAKNILAARQDQETEGYRIPRIVHQIWLGSPLPKKYQEWVSSWMNLHGWEYKLWTNEDVKDMVLYNQDLYDRSSNYGEKSDILRLEILHRYGGIYVDVDYECLSQEFFDEMHKHYDFYMGFEPLEHGLLDGYDTFKVCNALIATIPGHPLIENFIVNMHANYLTHGHLWVVERTGPAYLTREMLSFEFNNLNHGYRNMYLPCTFLYPFSEPEVREASLDTASHVDGLKASPETAAIHYWSGSWNGPGYVGSNLYFNKETRCLTRKE